jgi:hypothetical protein
MHTIDKIAVVLFIVWIFGFIHIAVAMTIIAVLYGLVSRKKIFSVIGGASTATIRKQHNIQPKQLSKYTGVQQGEKVEG